MGAPQGTGTASIMWQAECYVRILLVACRACWSRYAVSLIPIIFNRVNTVFWYVARDAHKCMLYAQRLRRAAQGCPPVDLLLRTSGEARLSDFLLWQAGGAQLAFARALWPELSFADLLRALVAFQRAAPRLAALRAAAAAEAGLGLGSGAGPEATVPAVGSSKRPADRGVGAAGRRLCEATTPGVDPGPAAAACGGDGHAGAAAAPHAHSAGPRDCGDAAAFLTFCDTHVSAVRRRSIGELAESTSVTVAQAHAHPRKALSLRAAEPCSRPDGQDGMGGALGGGAAEAADAAKHDWAQHSMPPMGLAGDDGEGKGAWWGLARGAAEAPRLLRRRSCGRLEAAPAAAITARF